MTGKQLREGVRSSNAFLQHDEIFVPEETKPSAPVAGSAVLCCCAGCPKKPHAAKWLLKGQTYFPMCDNARDFLINPPVSFRPGLKESDFAPLPPTATDNRKDDV